jgi:hypothetical protein
MVSPPFYLHWLITVRKQANFISSHFSTQQPQNTSRPQTKRCKVTEQMAGKNKKGKNKPKKEEVDEPVCQFGASDVPIADKSRF